MEFKEEVEARLAPTDCLMLDTAIEGECLRTDELVCTTIRGRRVGIAFVFFVHDAPCTDLSEMDTNEYLKTIFRTE